MPIPEGFLDELKARAPLAAVVGKRVKLQRRGREFLGLCPFHNEKTPSFTVNEDKGFYHCFGCGAHGSAIDFVMQTQGLEFREAVERLAADAGMEVPEESPEAQRRAERRTALVDVTEAAARAFERALRMPEGAEALAYLRRRGLDDAAMARFRLGFAPEAAGWLQSVLARDGIGPDMLLEAGLLIAPEDGGRAPYARFRGRIMFPIADRRGRVIAFGGRTLGGGGPKYLNSPETPLFHKGHELYGLHLAADAARAAGSVIVAEGYMDVIALHGAGYAHTVAPLGTALTEEQVRLLWRLAPEPILLFDPDEAGRRAAARAAERALPLLRAGYGLRFASLETRGDDPDVVARCYAPEFLNAALRDAMSLTDMLYWMESGSGGTATAEARAAAEARLNRHVAQVGDPVLRRHMGDAFREKLRPRRPGRRSGGAVADEPPAVTGPPAPGGGADDARRRREAILLAVVINHPEAFDTVGERLGSLQFAAADLDTLRQAVLFALSSGQDLDSTGLKSHLRECGFSALLEGVLAPHVYADAFFAKPGVALNTATDGWIETYSRYRRRELRAELENRKHELRNHQSLDKYRQFASLKQQENESSG